MVVSDAGSRKILGALIVGPHATELDFIWSPLSFCARDLQTAGHRGDRFLRIRPSPKVFQEAMRRFGQRTAGSHESAHDRPRGRPLPPEYRRKSQLDPFSTR